MGSNPAGNVNPVPADGGGPGGHPGVQRFKLDGSDLDIAVLESGLESGAEFLGFYYVDGYTFAVFAHGYK